MIEWCYQGDDPKFIENHYKGVDDSENEVRRKTADALVGNLGKECFCGLKSEDKNIKNFDAKDAKYFINL